MIENTTIGRATIHWSRHRAVKNSLIRGLIGIGTPSLYVRLPASKMIGRKWATSLLLIEYIYFRIKSLKYDY